MKNDVCTKVFVAWDKYIRHSRTVRSEFKGFCSIRNNYSGEITVYAESMDMLLDKVVEKYKAELQQRILTTEGI